MRRVPRQLVFTRLKSSFRLVSCDCIHPALPASCREISTTVGLSITTKLTSYGCATSISPVPAGGRSFQSLSTRRSNIYALSTAVGRSAIAIIRISGPDCLSIYQALCPAAPNLRHRYACLRILYEPSLDLKERQVLDPGAIVIYFPASNTVTGEDVLEFQVHGGPAIVKSVLAAIPNAYRGLQGERRAKLQAIRHAEPGEFTRRAFYNNRLDLAQIEALGDSLSAETEQQRRLAVRGTQNVLTHRYMAWRSQLLYARGELEALIDFSEDQHLEESPAKLVGSVAGQVKLLREQLHTSINNASKGELIRNGIKIALLGPPNVGKSSLMNLIVGREAAIVSEEPGTTRDVLEFKVDIGGYLCLFGDLAGLRGLSGADPATEKAAISIGKVEEEGIRRAKSWIQDADVIVLVLAVEPDQANWAISVHPEVIDTLNDCVSAGQEVLYVINKIDLINNSEKGNLDMSAIQYLFKSRAPNMAKFSESAYPAGSSSPGQVNLDACNGQEEPLGVQLFRVSCKQAQAAWRNHPDGGGIRALMDGLITTCKRLTDFEGYNRSPSAETSFWEQSLGASERQRVLLAQCYHHLEGFLAHVEIRNVMADASICTQDVDIVLAAESLRAAADCLAKITGSGESGDVEEVLGVVFEKFCVGK